MNPYSRFHLSFNLGYPNAYDRSHGRTGSALMVHGACVSIGCFAMTDHAMEQIYALAHAALTHGQPFFRVHIFPFPMEDHHLNNHLNSRWIEFWKNLQTGYRWFNSTGSPPNVEVNNGRYIFNNRG
jgi:murein L,D-transpeptidase YafK